MRVEYRDNTDIGPGNGILVFSEDILPDAPWSVVITRSSDHANLTGKKNNLWAGETTFLSLAGQPSPEGALELFIGPEIVNALDLQESYRVTLKGADGEPLHGRLKLDSITFTPAGSNDNTAEPKPAASAEKIPSSAVAATASVPEAPASAAAPETLDMGDASTEARREEKKKKWLAWLILAFVALLCLAWFAIDFLMNPKGEQPLEPAAVETPATSGESSTVVIKVNEFLGGSDPSPQTALALIGELSGTTNQDRDALYRLYYFGAKKDIPEALVKYGECLDPSLPAWGTIEKDAPEAMGAYGRSEAKKPGSGAPARENLLNWLEKAGASGNARAAEWLAQIKK